MKSLSLFNIDPAKLFLNFCNALSGDAGGRSIQDQPDRVHGIPGTPGNEVMAGPESLRRKQREQAQPLASGSTQFSDLAPLAGNRRPPVDLSATTVRRRSPLRAPARAASPPASSSSKPVDLTRDDHEPADASPDLHLPLEIREQIASALCGTDEFQTFGNLHSLSLTATAFRSAIKEDAHLRYDELRGKVDAANTLAGELLSSNIPREVLSRAIEHIGPMLPFLTPGNRECLFEAARAVIKSTCNFQVLKGLAAGITFLSEPQQRYLVGVATRLIVHSEGKSLMALLPAMAHLSKRNCDFFLKEVNQHIGSEHASGNVLAKLATGMNHLSVKQRDSLVTAAMALGADAERAVALGGLGAGMAHLTEMQREEVVIAAAIEIQNEKDRGLALAGLGAGLAHLSDQQRELLVTAAISIGDTKHMSCALQGLSAGVAHLKETQREKMVSAAVAISTRENDAKENTLSCLCIQGVHLSESQRARLAASANGITDAWSRTYVLASMAHFGQDHFQSFVASFAMIAMIEDSNPGCPLGQAGAVMAYLSEAQRDQLIDAAAGLRDDREKSVALLGLGKGLAYLNELQRDRIVVAIAGMNNRDAMKRTVDGLHAAAEYWSAPQRGRLMAACTGWTDTRAALQAGMFATRSLG